MSKTTKVHRENYEWFLNQPMDLKFELLGNHFELCRVMINQIFEELVREKTGDRYSHAENYESSPRKLRLVFRPTHGPKI